ncbi:hypothetical protein QBC41DRAFT_338799 [Cercophora samala]|uniref:RING-type domain-containing protein n=1 Tax=Cercophora samala TaxID=330535 RepID=A0AA39Z9M5_9PEZI|nr:hypothetical protein QBC41DRAFT_338799 [Cercophora samala]
MASTNEQLAPHPLALTSDDEDHYFPPRSSDDDDYFLPMNDGFASAWVDHLWLEQFRRLPRDSISPIFDGLGIAPAHLTREEEKELMVVPALPERGLKAGEDAICPICYGEMEAAAEVPACGHIFHGECLGVWLKWSDTCPICRGPVRAEEKEEEVTVEVSLLDLERLYLRPVITFYDETLENLQQSREEGDAGEQQPEQEHSEEQSEDQSEEQSEGSSD